MRSCRRPVQSRLRTPRLDRPPAPIKTPFVKACVVDGESGLCMGCYRKLNEVAGWAKLNDAERETIMGELKVAAA